MIQIQKKWKINDAYVPYVNDTTRIQIFFGGSSSGKSVFLAQRAINDLINGGRNYLIARNTGRTNKGSTFNELRQVITEWDLDQLFKINKSDLTITCRNGYQAVFCGLDDVEKIKSMRPAKGVFTDIWLEEATESHYDDYKKLTKRLRGLAGLHKRITLSFNPIFRTHWICREFFGGFGNSDNQYRDEGLSILRTTHKDNRFLDPEDRKALEDETNEYYYNVYTLGEWGVLGSVIFTNWTTADLSGYRDAFGTYDIGLDYGYTNDPSVLIKMAIKEKNLYVTNELYEYGLTNDLLAQKIIPIAQKEIIRCDPSEPKSTQELRGYGLNTISARGGPGSVNYGIQYLQQFNIIVDKRCQNWINEATIYQWETNKDGEVLNKPVDKNNHAMDASRYGVSGRIKLQPRKRGSFNRDSLGLSA